MRCLTSRGPGGLHYLFTMRRCLHCLEPACASACPTTALNRQPDGPVTYDADKCIGCRYCIWACPWGVPTAEWDSLAPKIQKCTHCADRADQPAPLACNGQALYRRGEQAVPRQALSTPACVKACPADALRFGTRDDILQEAHNRISDRPDKYVDHIYGEKEAGRHERVVSCPPSRSRSSAFPTSAPRRIRPSPKWRYTLFHLRFWPWARCWVAVYAFLKRRTFAMANGSDAAHPMPPSTSPGVRASPVQAVDSVQLGPSLPHGIRRHFAHRPLRLGLGRQHSSCPTLTPGGSGSSSTWSGSPWLRARSRLPASSMSFSEKTSTPWAVQPC